MARAGVDIESKFYKVSAEFGLPRCAVTKGQDGARGKFVVDLGRCPKVLVSCARR